VDLQQWCLWYKRRGAGWLRRVLMREWDPIGVADVPEARGEYDGYIGLVGDRLRRGAPNQEVAALLESIRRDRMGLPAHSEADSHAAETLRAWYADEMRRWGSRQVAAENQR